MKHTILSILLALSATAWASDNHSTGHKEAPADKHEHDHETADHRDDEHDESDAHNDHADHKDNDDSDGHDDHSDHDEHEEEAARIDAQAAAANGIETIIATSGELEITRTLTGRVHVNPGRVSRLRARFPGLIEWVGAEPWTRVEKGQALAKIQSNDSLQSYALKAPISGWVVNRAAQAGEITGDEPLFVIANLSDVWVELDVFDHDLEKVLIGQPVRLSGMHGEVLAEGQIDQLSPLAIHAAQSVRARVVVPNPEGRLRPGQYVRGEVVVERRSVGLRVPKSALQRLDGEMVVFEQKGDQYEPRALQLGIADAHELEVISGLKPGARIVSANSYLIKADIEKSGASHEH